ncbi:hypothetical protein INT47_011451 [Mucor saturninus]|uniref:YEATS domain-containing protein n=1 Tax=Mucor saturninus TaxID=64648 RepID=A0A8H7QXF0_9FUNG|nr:hypothetical protein INT47_011451 [Mucor saturninus]
MELPNVDPPPKKTVHTIPRDESTRKKITDIIDHQFDLEIYLKQREVATIRQEIAKAESILEDLKSAVENESLAASMPEAVHYTRRSALYYHGGPQALMNPAPSTAVKKKVYRLLEKNQLFGRRYDGVYVRLACPVCHRDDFANQQGFLNHCRLSHNLEFGPYEQCMLQCGTPVDESEVPLDNPARLRPIMGMNPAMPRALQKKLERPSIKVFEEDVDMELENEKRHSTPLAATSAAVPISSSTIPVAKQAAIAKPNNAPATEPSLMPSNIPTPSTNAVPQTEDKSIHPTATLPVIDRPDKASKLVPESETGEIVDKPKSEEVKKEDTPSTPKVESFAAAVTPSTADVGSRFYIKRRIIVGNVSKYMAPERRDPALKQFTHKWMIYVVEPPQSKQDVSAFITCVRFYLHPSYKPNDIIDVTEAPFKLTRLGWGEFPIRIQLFFVDKKRNKTVDLIHHLKLDDSHSGKQLLGSERSIEIELDRNTDFKDTSFVPPQKESEAPAIMAVRQKISLLGGILKECVRKLPIVRAGSHGTVLPYSCASSSQIFFKWSVGKRKALEWHRARLLRLEAQKRAYEVNDNVLRMAAEALTTKDVVLWCVKNKYTPVKSDSIEDVVESGLKPGYCKFCGSVRDGHDETIDDNCPRRPKGWNSRKRNGGINSTTSVSKLLSTLEQGWEDVKDSDDDMDVDIDMDEEPTTTKEEVTRRNDISERVKHLTLDSMDVANERSLDWMWSVVGQLRLKSVIANDMLLAKDGNLQGPTSSFDLSSAMNQRLVVGNILTQATRVFLKKLVNKTVNKCRKEEEGSADKSVKMMVPYHVYQAAQETEDFDFLTNQYMGPEDPDVQQKGN